MAKSYAFRFDLRHELGHCQHDANHLIATGQKRSLFHNKTNKKA